MTELVPREKPSFCHQKFNSGIAQDTASNAKSLAFISDLLNGRGLFKYAQDNNLISIGAVGGLHFNGPVLFIDHFSRWLEPPAALASLIIRAGKVAEAYTLNELHARAGLVPRQASAALVGFKRFLCSATDTEVSIPILKERGRLSPVYGWNVIKSSVSRLVRSLFALKDAGHADYLMCMDLTYPKDISLFLLSDFEGTIARAARCLQAFIQKVELNFYGGAELCVHENTHAWASKTPFEPHLHHHVHFPNCIKTDRGLKRVRPGFFRGKGHDLEKLELLRDLWKKSIIETFGEVIPVDSWNSNLKPHYIKLTQRAKLVHRLKYASRRPMSDFFEYYHDDDCPSERLRFVLDLFCYKNPRHHFGWGIASMVNVQRGLAHVCPICHAPAKQLETTDTLDPGLHIVIYYHNLWNWIPPPGYSEVIA